MWIQICHQVAFQTPKHLELVSLQFFFWNVEICYEKNNMYSNTSYAFGSNLIRKELVQMKDLWDSPKKRLEIDVKISHNFAFGGHYAKSHRIHVKTTIGSLSFKKCKK